jgi:hypothetical protein
LFPGFSSPFGSDAAWGSTVRKLSPPKPGRGGIDPPDGRAPVGPIRTMKARC